MFIIPAPDFKADSADNIIAPSNPGSPPISKIFPKSYLLAVIVFFGINSFTSV